MGRLIDQILDHGGAHPASDRPAPPARGLVILTCMDARIDPLAFGGFDLGDAHVIRNAGGLATDDAIRSIAISQLKLGTTEVLVVGHTNCGLHGATDEDLASELEALAGEQPSWAAGGFSDLDQSVAASVERLRASPFLSHTGAIRGAVIEVETGRLRPIGG